MTERLVLRHEKVAYFETEEGKFTRMEGFTEMPTAKEVAEYQRKYVDESSERTSITGVNVSLDYKFDQFQGNKVHDVIVDITDNDKLGKDAEVKILIVDFSSPIGTGTDSTEFKARLRPFTVAYDTDGGDEEAYTYEGSFKSNGDQTTGTAKVSDKVGVKWMAAAFTPEGAEGPVTP